MSVAIRLISNTSKRELRDFIRFNYKLYKGNKYAVPEMYRELLNTFMPARNGAYDFCDAQFFMAYKDGKAAGRVAAIINHRANETWGTHTVRFGWIDFVDDKEVSAALIAAVEKWGRERGMDTIEGPLGFTDFDREGMLIEGFEELATMATHYNYPYYVTHMEHLGFEKAVDWKQYKIFPSKELPEKIQRVCDIIQERYNLRVVKYTSAKKLRKERGKEIFDLMNEAYAPLHGFSALSERQINQYIDTYLGLVDLRFVSLVIDDQDRLIGVGIAMPSLSRALRRSRGARRLWGYIPLAWALFVKHEKNLDLLIMGVHPEYHGKGVNALLMASMLPAYHEMGFQYAESNLNLEDNNKIQSQWDYFDHVNHKRNRSWKKKINP
jgi:GNAT superfamily N-acetyltransferase